MQSQTKVLVASASRHGSTRGVAERVATVLDRPGTRVDLRRVDEIEDDIAGYDAVVFGSAVYDGSWPPEAVTWVRDNIDALAGRPAWLFSVGAFGDRHRLIGGLMKREPREIGGFTEAIHPIDYRVFAGVVEHDQWPLYGRVLLRVFGGHIGDNRDWAEIEAWARTIAGKLSGTAPAPPD